MKENPANKIKDTMWKFLMDHGQQSNIPALKEYVYDLIGMTTQKTAGQEKYAAKNHIDWNELDMTMMSIVIEATALVLSGDLEKEKSLLNLQCEVGDDIYSIPSKVNFNLNKLSDREELNKVYHSKIAMICINGINEDSWYIVSGIDLEYGTGRTYASESYETTWFLSEKQAEEALAKMKSEAKKNDV